MSGRAYIGISGWSYPAWRGDFYPRGLPQRRELESAAERMTSIELNGSFYSLQRPTSYRRWASQVPDGFVLAVKGSRYITHMKRLVDVEQALTRFWDSGVRDLGLALGPVLWQLPERLAYDPAVVEDFLALLPRDLRHAVELRSPTFDTDRFHDQLRSHGVACVLADTAGRWPMVERDTADFRYVRLHGHTELYTSGYAARSLNAWASRISAWLDAGQDVHCYFDNDARGRAPHDAMGLLARVRGSGA